MNTILERLFLRLRGFLLACTIATLAACGSSGDSSDEDVGFPTPTLPADAARFDNTNANTIATAAVGFVDTLDSVTQFKTETSLSVLQVIEFVTDRITERARNSGLIAARTEDISAGLCVSGSATATYTENGSSESGTVSFSECDVGSGIMVDGGFRFIVSWNDTTLDYSLQTGGTIDFDFGSDLVTIEMNLIESGNYGTGDFSGTISFSLSGIPGGGFLVQTAQPWTGNALSLQVNSGQLIVYGSDNTRLRITVTGVNTADVDLDNGSGTFVFDSTISF